MRLEDDSTVFQAEVWAIKMALEQISQQDEKADICVDSQAVLSAFFNIYHSKVHVNIVHDLLLKNKVHCRSSSKNSNGEGCGRH